MNKEWTEFLESLVAHQVEFVVIGAWAMAFHGKPRYTGDLDIFVRPSVENGKALLDALREFGAPTYFATEDELATSGFTLTFGVPPARIDILNWLSGLSFEDAYSDAVTDMMGSTEVKYLSKRALTINKLASGRAQDFVDLETLNRKTDSES